MINPEYIQKDIKNLTIWHWLTDERIDQILNLLKNDGSSMLISMEMIYDENCNDGQAIRVNYNFGNVVYTIDNYNLNVFKNNRLYCTFDNADDLCVFHNTFSEHQLNINESMFINLPSLQKGA